MRRIIAILLLFVLLCNTLMIEMGFADDENIAIGKPVTASTMGAAPTNINDGSYSTFWARGGTVLEGKHEGCDWICIDLEKSTPLERIAAYTRTDIDGMDYKGRLRVELSNDSGFASSKLFTMVAGEKSGNNQQWVVQLSGEESYRYVRVRAADQAYILLSEIEIYKVSAPYDPKKAVYSDVEASKYKGPIKLLQALDVNYAKEKAEYGVNLLATRGLAVDVAMQTFYKNIDCSTEQAESFADVAPTHPLYQSIQVARTIGIVKGDERNQFRPDSYITAHEFAIILLRILGYDGDYNNSAELGKMLSNVSLAPVAEGVYSLSYGELAQMVVNALIAKPYRDDYIVSYGKPFLEKLYGLTIYKGIAHETGRTSLSYAKTKANHYAKVGDMTFKDASDKLSTFIGYHVCVCADEDNNVVAAWEDKNTIQAFSIEEISTYPRMSGGAFEVIREGNRREKYVMAPSFDVVYNDSVCFDAVDQTLQPANGRIKLLDNDGDEMYDVVFIEAYEIVQVSVLSSNNDFVNLLAANGKSYRFETEKLFVYDANGASKTLSKIKTNAIVKLYPDDVTGITKVILCEPDLTGVFLQRSADTVTIGAEEYELAQNYFEKTPIKLGARVHVYLDENDRVIGIQRAEETDTFKIAFSIALSAEGELAARHLMKLYNENGEFFIYPIASKVIVDGYTKTTRQLQEFADNNPGVVEGEFIRYKLNENSEICEIDTKQVMLDREDPYTTMTRSADIVGGVYAAGGGYFYDESEFMAWAPSSTLSFTIPRVEGAFTPDERYHSFYNVGNVSSIAEDKGLAIGRVIGQYMVDEDGKAGFLARINDYAALTGNMITAITETTAPFMIIEKVVELYDGNKITYQVTGYDIKTMAQKTLTIEDVEWFAETGLIFQEKQEWLTGFYVLDAALLNSSAEKDRYVSGTSTLKCGDVIRYSLVDGVIRSVERVYAYNANSRPKQEKKVWMTVNTQNPYYHYSSNRFQFGRLANLTAKSISFDTIANKDELYDKSSFAGSLVVDVERNRIEKGSVDAMINYGDACYQMLICTENGGKPTVVIAYKYN